MKALIISQHSNFVTKVLSQTGTLDRLGATLATIRSSLRQFGAYASTHDSRREQIEAEVRALELEVLKAYRAFYKAFGQTYHVQLQLESVVHKGKSLPSVSLLVDANFMAELKTLVLTTGHDADRLEYAQTQHDFVVVLGGECSILVENALALKRRGRYGLVFIDGHSDFPHPQNAPAIGAAAGEDLAIVTERGDARLINLEQLGPYIEEADIALIGVRPYDEYLSEMTELGFAVTTSAELTELRPKQAAKQALETVTRSTQGF